MIGKPSADAVSREVRYEDPLVDELRLHRGNAVVVPAEGAHAARHGRVGAHGHVRRAVAERAAIPRPEKRGPGERDLVLEQPVRLGRMAARLVHEQREELGGEDQGRGPLGRERRVERRLCVVAIPLRTRDEVEVLDVFPAGLPGEPRVGALCGLRAGLHRENRESRPRLHDFLRHVGAVARDQVLAGAVRGDGGAARFDVGAD